MRNSTLTKRNIKYFISSHNKIYFVIYAYIIFYLFRWSIFDILIKRYLNYLWKRMWCCLSAWRWIRCCFRIVFFFSCIGLDDFDCRHIFEWHQRYEIWHLFDHMAHLRITLHLFACSRAISLLIHLVDNCSDWIKRLLNILI